MRPRKIAARPNLLVADRRDGYLITPPESFWRSFKSVEALMAWARSGCPDYDERHPAALTFFDFDQFRRFARAEGWREDHVDLIIAQVGSVLVIPVGGTPADAAEGGAFTVQPFTQNGTYEPIQNVNYMLVQGCGGGGGGGGGGMPNANATNLMPGGGGGGGSLLGSLLIAAPTAQATVTVGAGGRGGAGQGNFGGGVAGTAGEDGIAGSPSTIIAAGITLISFSGASGGGGGDDLTALQGRAGIGVGAGGSSCTANGANAFSGYQFLNPGIAANPSAAVNGIGIGSGGCSFTYQGLAPAAGLAAGSGADNTGPGQYLTTSTFGGSGGNTGTAGAQQGGGGGGGGGAGPNGSGGNGGNGGNFVGAGSPGTSATTNSGAGGGGGGTASFGSSTITGGNGGNGGSGYIVVVY